LRILIVEDAPHVRKFLVAGLEREGHELSDASDIKEAQKLLKDGFFDLVILDRGLPDGDGLESFPC